MSRNVEIKAHVSDRSSLEARTKAIATEGPFEILQDDTFFTCTNGRLKLRMFGKDRGELIFYQRTNHAGPRESFYLVSETTQPEVLRDSLALAYGVSGRLKKHRTLYLINRTRVHLDRVEGLGEFMELEVVLNEGDSLDEGNIEARNLMQQLGIDQSELITGSYADLISELNR